MLATLDVYRTLLNMSDAQISLFFSQADLTTDLVTLHVDNVIWITHLRHRSGLTCHLKNSTTTSERINIEHVKRGNILLELHFLTSFTVA